MDLVAPSVQEEDVVVPLIFHVSLDVRTKVVTVHSTIQLWNATNLSLAFEALLLAPTRGSVASSRYSKYTIGTPSLAVHPPPLPLACSQLQGPTCSRKPLLFLLTSHEREGRPPLARARAHV